MQLDDWLSKALLASGHSQVDLATFLSERLSRTIDKGAVNRMLSGGRKISGDELLAISEICRYPLPVSNHKISEGEDIAHKAQLMNDLFRIDVTARINFSELKRTIEEGVFQVFTEMSEDQAERVANVILFEIFRVGKFTLIFRSASQGLITDWYKAMKRMRRDFSRGLEVLPESEEHLIHTGTARGLE